jgi:hypothetical protein
MLQINKAGPVPTDLVQPDLLQRNLVRAIGRWSLVALTVNSIIGSGVFGLPSVVAGLIGKFSTWAVLLGWRRGRHHHRLLGRSGFALRRSRWTLSFFMREWLSDVWPA